MPKVFYTQPDGTVVTVEGAAGDSVMLTAVRNGVPGVVGQCGGSLSCATCHVYVDPEWVARLPDRQSDEADLLSILTTYDKATSRLSCQVEFTAALDGIRLTVAPEE